MTTTTFHTSFAPGYIAQRTAPSLFTKFIIWCAKQQPARLLWLGAIVALHGCVLTPMTIMMVLFAGNNFFLFMLTASAMAMALVTNLAAMPTKITIPVFFLTLLIDLVVLISCFALGFNATMFFR